jgi:maltooligosyltrehalose trehalohydrolase
VLSVVMPRGTCSLEGAVVENTGSIRTVGASPVSDGVEFRIWAPTTERLAIVLRGRADGAHPLEREPDGWFTGFVRGAAAGDRYRLTLNGGEPIPDPFSRSQPDGVHGDSEIVDAAAFEWHDTGWTGRPLEDLVIYELHVGTATAAGTFDALVPHLPDLVDLGVTAIELMPVGEFAGTRNWGYDGVYLFAPSRAYGGPDGLRRLVDAAHAHGVAVILDVVYNHFGPEGNYLPAVTGGRIFTERHDTPWGAAVNYDDDGSAAVREIVLGNVREWIRDYHIDGLRLDATHAIADTSTPHILAEIATAARGAADRHVVVIAEDERNERQLLLPQPEGFGIDAVWADDAHHSVRRLLAGDSDGYFAAYSGSARELERTLRHGWLYQGDWNATTDERRGTPSDGIPPQRFVHCMQNHDQVGNRALGERLHHQIDLAAYRAASALLLLSPATPLLWMGQEWAASSPFLYFTDHPDHLGRLVTNGRRDEFSHFAAFADPAMRAVIPDPQAESTFRRSRLDWSEREAPPHVGVLRLYRTLLALRNNHPALQTRDPASWHVRALSDHALALRREASGHALLLIANLRGTLDTKLTDDMVVPSANGAWHTLLTTNDSAFGGEGGEDGEDGEDGDAGAFSLHSDGRVLITGPCAILLSRGDAEDTGGAES